MIKAKLVKAVPLKDGTTTYMLTGKTDRAALHAAVDLQDQELTLEPATDNEPTIDTLDGLVQMAEMLASKLRAYLPPIPKTELTIELEEITHE